MKKNALLSVFVFACIFTAILNINAQTIPTNKTEDEAKKSAGSGITFKIPDKVIPMKWNDFKGMLMLSEKLPSGIFISYPEESESIADLKIRAEKSVAAMFFRDDKKVDEIVWETKTVPSHKGDSGETAVMKTFDNSEQSFQITIYEREWNGLKLIYGYFARKSKTSKNKDNSAEFLDEKGGGVKIFDSFWKTFPNK